MDTEERQRRISEAAYFRAEKRGFAANAELEDWLEAERDFDRLLTPFPDAMPSEGPETTGSAAERENSADAMPPPTS